MIAHPSGSTFSNVPKRLGTAGQYISKRDWYDKSRSHNDCMHNYTQLCRLLRYGLSEWSDMCHCLPRLPSRPPIARHLRIQDAASVTVWCQDSEPRGTFHVARAEPEQPWQQPTPQPPAQPQPPPPGSQPSQQPPVAQQPPMQSPLAKQQCEPQAPAPQQAAGTGDTHQADPEEAAPPPRQAALQAQGIWQAAEMQDQVLDEALPPLSSPAADDGGGGRNQPPWQGGPLSGGGWAGATAAPPHSGGRRRTMRPPVCACFSCALGSPKTLPIHASPAICRQNAHTSHRQLEGSGRRHLCTPISAFIVDVPRAAFAGSLRQRGNQGQHEEAAGAAVRQRRLHLAALPGPPPARRLHLCCHRRGAQCAEGESLLRPLLEPRHAIWKESFNMYLIACLIATQCMACRSVRWQHLTSRC